jgi:hypothetical protein
MKKGRKNHLYAKDQQRHPRSSSSQVYTKGAATTAKRERERAKIALPACHVGPEDCRSHDGCKVTLDKENEKTRIMRSQEKEKAFAGPGQQASHTHTLMMQFVIKGV